MADDEPPDSGGDRRGPTAFLKAVPFRFRIADRSCDRLLAHALPRRADPRHFYRAALR